MARKHGYIQSALDPYACAVYIWSYITKGQRGMRNAWKACQEAKSGNKDNLNQVRQIGDKFLNSVEISAQELVYLVLQLPLRQSSHQVQFVNTAQPDDRSFLLKSIDKILDLPDSSKDIESDSLINKYQRRPRQLEKMCLADFTSMYDCVKETTHKYNMIHPLRLKLCQKSLVFS